MRRGKRAELGTLSVSAIDLFASALGAFIVISLVLFPYFPNLENLRPLIEELRAEIADLEDALGEQEAINAQLSDQNDALAAANDRLQGQVASLETQIGGLQGQLADAARASAAAQQVIDNLRRQVRGSAYIGIEPQHSRFQIVIDISGSVSSFRPQVRGIAQRIVDRLEPDDEVRVLLYSGDVGSPRILAWPGGGGFHRIGGDADKAAAMDFIRSGVDQSDGCTPTFDAMRMAVGASAASSIFLITDGLPQVAPGCPSYATPAQARSEIDALTRQNGGRHQINMVGIGEFTDPSLDSANVPTAHAMGFLAHLNGGAVVAMQR